MYLCSDFVPFFLFGFIFAPIHLENQKFSGSIRVHMCKTIRERERERDCFNKGKQDLNERHAIA